MKSKRSLRLFSKTLTAVGLALAVSACSTVYQDDWNQDSNVPDLNEPAQRSLALLGYCKKLHSRGDLNLAAGICNRAHEINPTDPLPLIELARVLEKLEMTASAEEAYRAALLLDPQQIDALYGLGKIYIDQQRYDMAMGPLEAAAQMPTDDSCHVARCGGGARRRRDRRPQFGNGIADCRPTHPRDSRRKRERPGHSGPDAADGRDRTVATRRRALADAGALDPVSLVQRG
jgi:tetratricopeptide (TPR) repeat protein